MDWINSIPYVTRSQEPKIRVRWLPKEQANYLINNLQLKWMKQVCSFALLTGARMSEIFTLTWMNVNLSNRLAVVTHTNAKSGKARALVLNKQVIQLIGSLSRDSDYVFTREIHKRIYDIDRRDFKRALQLSRIDNFHFHDLRHRWASWHVQAGTPLFTLKEMSGWESLEMVRKYAHLNASHMLDFADNVTFTSQSMCHNEIEKENLVII